MTHVPRKVGTSDRAPRRDRACRTSRDDARLAPDSRHARMSENCQERNTTRINSTLYEAGIARPQGDKLSGRPSESPTYCSTPAAANYRTSSRPHLVRVRELVQVGTLR